MRRVSSILLVLLTACTTPIVRDTTSIDAKTDQCETVDCVIQAMDELPQGSQEDRYPFMEGYPDSKLGEMERQNRLRVAVMNPLLILLGFYGWSYIEPGKYGGVRGCDVHYLPGFNWLSLKHELSHCQGYADHGIPIEIATYTPEQQEIMDREHVSKWTDTKYYRGMTQ